MADEQAKASAPQGDSAEIVIKFIAAVLAAPKVSALLAKMGIVQVDPTVMGAALVWGLHKLHIMIWHREPATKS